MSYYTVYLVKRLGMPRNHHVIFVELSPEDETGVQYHVTGTVQVGMEFEIRKEDTGPRESPSFVSMSKLGLIKASDLDRLESICQSNPPPAKQFDGSHRIGKTKPLRRCQEWVSETVGLLRAEGVLV
ncbi:unnamed protein product [Fusarium equiseti]|uniref:Uncharacterized protein n=1 Tax=Fusarium equiseti TaxID=61235 RepID=A0A8J2NDI0_FUSEQ|nr:unnamed protein product [Fusarium equiseti]